MESTIAVFEVEQEVEVVLSSSIQVVITVDVTVIKNRVEFPQRREIWHCLFIVIGQPASVPIQDEAPALPTQAPEFWRIVRFALIELLLYAVLVVLYAFIILRFLPAPLLALFEGNPYLYAFVSLFLIVAQGNVLEALTAFLLDRLRLERFE